MDELNNKIKIFIEEFYECTFLGKVITAKLNNTTYNVKIVLNSTYAPINLNYEGTEEDFLEFVKTQIKKRRLNLTQYYSGYKNETGGNY